MKRLAAVAAALGIGLAACSGHSSTPLIPSTGQSAQTSSQSTQASAFGTHSMRTLSVASAPSGWSTTATQAPSLLSATDLGALSSTQTLTVRLGLQLHNTSALQTAIQSHQKLTPSQFAANYGPTTSDVAAATTYLKSQGFTNITVEPNNLLISATGTTAQVQTAFDTSLHSFSTKLGTVFANVSPAYVPQSLGGIVIAVLGLNNAQMFTTAHHIGTVAQAPSSTARRAQSVGTPPSPCAPQNIELVGTGPIPEPSPAQNQVGCLRDYYVADFWRAYDVGNLPAANSVNVAIMIAGDPGPAISDFVTNEQGNNLPAVNVITKVVGLQAPSVTDGPGEWTLDLTASTGMAGAVNNVYLYETSSLTDSDTALDFNRWVTDDITPLANASFGGCEYGPYLDGSMVIDDEIFNEGAAQGQTLFASTGDTGAYCSVGTPNGVPAGAPLVSYPAASPYVVGVGGTTLDTATDGSYWGEASWYSGGGGVSQFEYGPYWEASAQPVNSVCSTSGAGCTYRGLPDVAMDADLQTGMNIYITGDGWTVIGGTSLASPLAVGAWARMLQLNPNLGFAPPTLYTLYGNASAGEKLAGPPPTEPWGPYHDILVGSNGAYSALPGYDYTTGLGSLDVQALASLLAPPPAMGSATTTVVIGQ